jgi:hypothetical protein
MRRRLSGILAVLALANLSFGGTVVRCPAYVAGSSGTPTHQAHAHHGMNGQQADARAGQEGTHSSNRPDCDHSAQGTCAGMLSCSVAIRSVAPARLAFVASSDQALPFVLDLLSGPNRAPETPPPRV